jgi:predicted acyltransferase
VGVPPDWPHRLSGFAAHWNKNTNLAHAFDVSFLNLFPRERPFAFNGGGYLTLNFVPSLATMIFGLIAGTILRSPKSDGDRLRLLITAGVAGLAIGSLLHVTGINPIVKRIWTPAWTVFSAGWVTLFLAGCYYLVDVRHWRRLTLPFIVVGANSIAMYVLVHVAVDYLERAFVIHFGRAPFEVLGSAVAPVLLGAATLAVLWGVLYWMYRNRVFVRI